eukprot:7142157-Alexandrium_andersonii.AAC.1
MLFCSIRSQVTAAGMGCDDPVGPTQKRLSTGARSWGCPVGGGRVGCDARLGQKLARAGRR